MRIALPAHQSLGHWDPLRTSSGWTLPGPFEIGHSNSIRLDQFRKNSWCSVGIDGYREAFVRPAWISMLSGGSFPILPYAGEIAPVPQLVAEQERLSKDCSWESFLHRSR